MNRMQQFSHQKSVKGEKTFPLKSVNVWSASTRRLKPALFISSCRLWSVTWAPGLRSKGQAVEGSTPQVPVYRKGQKESCQTFRNAPFCWPLPPPDPRAAAGRTPCGRPPAARGSAPSLLVNVPSHQTQHVS